MPSEQESENCEDAPRDSAKDTGTSTGDNGEKHIHIPPGTHLAVEATCKEDAFARYADRQEKKYRIACVVEVKSHPYKTYADLELIAPDAHDVVNEFLDRMRKDSKIYLLFCHKNGDDCITNKALVGKWELEVLSISEKNRKPTPSSNCQGLP